MTHSPKMQPLYGHKKSLTNNSNHALLQMYNGSEALSNIVKPIIMHTRDVSKSQLKKTPKGLESRHNRANNKTVVDLNLAKNNKKIEIDRQWLED